MNKYIKHKLKVIFGIGVPIGILLVIIQNTFNIQIDVMMKYYLIGSAVILVATLAINLIWQIKFQKEIFAASHILREDKNADLYIQTMQKLINKTRLISNKNLLLMNMSVGYSEKEDYHKAKEILLSINPQKINEVNRAVYFNNLASFSFMLDEKEEAIKIMEANHNLFSKYESSKVLGGCIAINRVYESLAKNEIGKAEELLIEAEKLCQNNYLKDDYEKVKDKLKSIKDKKDSN